MRITIIIILVGIGSHCLGQEVFEPVSTELTSEAGSLSSPKQAESQPGFIIQTGEITPANPQAPIEVHEETSTEFEPLTPAIKEEDE